MKNPNVIIYLLPKRKRAQESAWKIPNKYILWKDSSRYDNNFTNVSEVSVVDQRAEERQPDRAPLSAVEGAQDRGYGAQVPAHHHRLQQLLQARVPSA